MYNDINQKHKLENIPKSFMINDKKNYISLVKDFTNRIRPALDSIPESNQSRQVLELLYFKKQTWQEISSKFA